jgi:hypothetical protein
METDKSPSENSETPQNDWLWNFISGGGSNNGGDIGSGPTAFIAFWIVLWISVFMFAAPNLAGTPADATDSAYQDYRADPPPFYYSDDLATGFSDAPSVTHDRTLPSKILYVDGLAVVIPDGGLEVKDDSGTSVHLEVKDSIWILDLEGSFTVEDSTGGCAVEDFSNFRRLTLVSGCTADLKYYDFSVFP